MKKLIMVSVLCCIGLLPIGCSPEQMQQQAQISKVTNDTSAIVTKIWADANLPETEKVKATAAVIAQYSKDVGLIDASQESAFLNYVNWAWTTFQAWYPEKTTVGLIGLIIWSATTVAAGRKKKVS